MYLNETSHLHPRMKQFSFEACLLAFFFWTMNFDKLEATSHMISDSISEKKSFEDGDTQQDLNVKVNPAFFE